MVFKRDKKEKEGPPISVSMASDLPTDRPVFDAPSPRSMVETLRIQRDFWRGQVVRAEENTNDLNLRILLLEKFPELEKLDKIVREIMGRFDAHKEDLR